MSTEAYMRKARKKYIYPLATARFCDVLDGFFALNKRQTVAMIRAAESCSTTNCWYAEWDVAQYILPRLRERLQRIESKRRGAK